MTKKIRLALLALFLCLLSIESTAQTTDTQTIPALVDEIEGNQKEFVAKLQAYKFTLKRIEQELNDKNEVRSEKVSVYEVFPGPDGTPIQMLLRENGKDLSAEEIRKGKKRVNKLWKRAKEEVAKGKGKNAREWPRSIFRELVFSMLRMDRIRDREMIVLRVSPKPNNASKDFMSQVEGEMWIDLKDKSLARLDARLSERYKVGGGFLFPAYLQPGTSIVIESAPLPGGIWATTLMEFTPVPKSSLGVKIPHTKQREESSEYLPFDVNVDRLFAEP